MNDDGDRYIVFERAEFEGLLAEVLAGKVTDLRDGSNLPRDQYPAAFDDIACHGNVRVVAHGETQPVADDEAAYDGSNWPQRRQLTARERDVVCGVLSDIITSVRHQHEPGRASECMKGRISGVSIMDVLTGTAAPKPVPPDAQPTRLDELLAVHARIDGWSDHILDIYDALNPRND